MISASSKIRLSLPQVTICAATSVNLPATICALESSMENIDFGGCLLFTDAPVQLDNAAITIVPIGHLGSAAAYSEFLLTRLADFITTSHCLVVQWDGHVIDATRWDPTFLNFDYIGASWPQFQDGFDVGNGGFSLRSRQLLAACKSPRFQPFHPEDVLIGRIHRNWLERQGIRFAPREVADRFSAERAGNPGSAFGYHGIWHMPLVLGLERFWGIYNSLDDRSTVQHDLWSLITAVGRGQDGCRRVLRMLVDGLAATLKGN